MAHFVGRGLVWSGQECFAQSAHEAGCDAYQISLRLLTQIKCEQPSSISLKDHWRAEAERWALCKFSENQSQGDFSKILHCQEAEYQRLRTSSAGWGDPVKDAIWASALERFGDTDLSVSQIDGTHAGAIATFSAVCLALNYSSIPKARQRRSHIEFFIEGELVDVIASLDVGGRKTDLSRAWALYFWFCDKSNSTDQMFLSDFRHLLQGAPSYLRSDAFRMRSDGLKELVPNPSLSIAGLKAALTLGKVFSNSFVRSPT